MTEDPRITAVAAAIVLYRIGDMVHAQGVGMEFVKMFSEHDKSLRKDASEFLAKLDAANAATTAEGKAPLKAARRVIWAWRKGWTWDELQDALLDLETVVGRPAKEGDI